MPIISVIITAYGNPLLLFNAIKSVLCQTLIDFELIIVDDNDSGSINREKTSNIVDMFAKKDQRIIYIKHGKNQNGAVARNTGIKACKGLYIAFLDSDDEYLPSRLELCHDALINTKDSKLLGVYTGCEFRRNNRKYKVLKYVKSGNFIVETLAGNFNFGTGSNIFMRSDVVRKLMFDETFTRHQDYEFLVRYFTEYDLIGLNQVLVIKNNDNNNLPSPEKMVEIKKQYIEKYANIIESYDESIANKILSAHCISLSKSFATIGKFQEAIKYMKKGSSINTVRIFDRLKILLLLAKSIFKQL
ncbi:MAG: glycosyltransferase family 2 protein [Bacillota bacterium]